MDSQVQMSPQVEAAARELLKKMIKSRRAIGRATSTYDEDTIDRRIAVLDAMPEDQQPGTQQERAFLEKCRAKLAAKQAAKA